MSFFTAEHITYRYPNGLLALDDISFSIEPEDCVGLVGSNGAGKSTLLAILCGLILPTSGMVSIDGISLNSKNLALIRNMIGLVFQNPDDQIFAHTVAAECGYWLANLAVPEPARTARVVRELAGLGLDRMLERSPFSLSFGEKRRLCLASVLVADPAVLCLDEPTTGLDDAAMVGLAEAVLARAGQGAAVLVATHEQAFAAMTASRIVRLEKGRIAADAPNPEGRHGV